MLALDTGILACALNRFVPEHPRASQVVEQLVNGDRPWALPWPVVHETLRLVTHPHAVVRPLRASDAWDFLGRVVTSPMARMLGPTERHAQALIEVLGSVPPERGLPPGIETAVVLREHGVRELLSADAGMRQFAFLSVIDPLRDHGWTPGGPPPRRYRVLRPR